MRAPDGPRERRVPVLQRPATWLAIAYGAIGAAAAILLALVSG